MKMSHTDMVSATQSSRCKQEQRYLTVMTTEDTARLSAAFDVSQSWHLAAGMSTAAATNLLTFPLPQMKLFDSVVMVRMREMCSHVSGRDTQDRELFL